MIDFEGLTTVADVSREQAKRRGGEIALACDDRTTTFAELDAEASRIANRLIADGIPPQERVAYLAKNN